MRCTRGQATVEYVALVAVVAILAGARLALAGAGAPGIVNAVVGQIRHALCIVGGGPCPDRRPRPCMVAGTRDTRHFAVGVVVVRFDHDRWVLREAMSDGTVRITVARSGALGAEVAVGGRAALTVRGRRIAIKDEARAGAQGVLARGTVYVARDAREAAATMRAIRRGDTPLAPARADFYEGGVSGLGSFGVGSSLAGASLEGLARTMVGARRDHATGDVTLALRSTASGWGAVTVALGGPAGRADREIEMGLRLDRHRRPVELSLSASGALAAGARLPPGLRRALGDGSSWLGSQETGGRRWQLAARLDLRDPLVSSAWAAFRRDPGSGAAMRALGEAIRDRAALDVSAYRTQGSSSGVAAGIGNVVQLGGEIDHATDHSRLLTASSRPAGGLWETRLDCLAATVG